MGKYEIGDKVLIKNNLSGQEYGIPKKEMKIMEGKIYEIIELGMSPNVYRIRPVGDKMNLHAWYIGDTAFERKIGLCLNSVPCLLS